MESTRSVDVSSRVAGISLIANWSPLDSYLLPGTIFIIDRVGYHGWGRLKVWWSGARKKLFRLILTNLPLRLFHNNCGRGKLV